MSGMSQTALFVGTHNDDVEYCAGGLAYTLSQRGFCVRFLNVACKRRVRRNADAIRALYADPEACARFRNQDMQAAAVLGAEKIIIGVCDDSFYQCTSDAIRAIGKSGKCISTVWDNTAEEAPLSLR